MKKQDKTSQDTRNRKASDAPATLGQLKASGWQPKSVKEELRKNAIAKIRADEDLFPSIWGYEESVFPHLEHALLAKHDIIFLGERGQAKTRLIRSIVELLDPWVPIVAGSEINDDPFNPVSKYAKELIAKRGDKTPIAWIDPSERFAEKLATPDTSIADLIGEVDPIKVAEGRYLSDELTLHYGLVPRVNRGIFAINELPDLAERIQVGLLNVLEERDVQIRGYRIRLPLDILLLASANPEDYTNRGRIITPLKDRFGSQIRTHYPRTVEIERQIMEQEVGVDESDEIPFRVPKFMSDILVRFSQELRDSSSIDQSSGVSVRLSVANYEVLVASATRRILETGEQEAVPRISDLDSMIPSMSGKVEFDSLETSPMHEIFEFHIKSAVLSTFSDYLDVNQILPLIQAFESGTELVVNTGETVASNDFLAVVVKIPELEIALRKLGLEDEDLKQGGIVASGVEFILEALHLNNYLNKRLDGKKVSYSTDNQTPSYKMEA